MIDVDLIDCCSKASYETLRTLDKSLNPAEYFYAYNTYTLLLLGCCCTYLIENGYSDDAQKLTKEVNRFFKEELPLSFTVWAYNVYNTQKQIDEKMCSGEDVSTGYKIKCGDQIGRYIFKEYLKTKGYFLVKLKLYETLEDTLGYLSQICLEEEIDTDKKFLNEQKTLFRVSFQDISGYIPSIWGSGHEWIWFKKAWNVLENQKMTSYSTPLEMRIVYLRALTLGMIYIDFCKVAMDEIGGYEDLLDTFRFDITDEGELGFIYAKFMNKNVYTGFNDAICELTDRERPHILRALFKEMDASYISVGMYCTGVDLSFFRYSDEDDNDCNDIMLFEFDDKDDEYTSYWNLIDENLHDIVDKYFFELMSGYSWINDQWADRITYI
ncbi:MAG: hypothetical protein K6G55_06640 [Selenomonadaceae bacterium]|nr:hypothetical protein [Selenomonadaceae bacterium]